MSSVRLMPSDLRPEDVIQGIARVLARVARRKAEGANILGNEEGRRGGYRPSRDTERKDLPGASTE
jgi:hypothetical protein